MTSPSDTPPADTSIICRLCHKTVGGVYGGDRMEWTTCVECAGLTHSEQLEYAAIMESTAPETRYDVIDHCSQCGRGGAHSWHTEDSTHCGKCGGVINRAPAAAPARDGAGTTTCSKTRHVFGDRKLACDCGSHRIMDGELVVGLPDGERTAPETPTDVEIIARVDRWFGGALCIAYKSHHEGRPNETPIYLYRSDVLAGLGVQED